MVHSRKSAPYCSTCMPLAAADGKAHALQQPDALPPTAAARWTSAAALLPLACRCTARRIRCPTARLCLEWRVFIRWPKSSCSAERAAVRAEHAALSALPSALSMLRWARCADGLMCTVPDWLRLFPTAY